MRNLNQLSLLVFNRMEKQAANSALTHQYCLPLLSYRHKWKWLPKAVKQLEIIEKEKYAEK